MLDDEIPNEDTSFMMPDYVPDWLVKEIRKSKGGLEGFEGLRNVYSATDVFKLDRFDKRHFQDIRKKSPELDGLTQKHWGEDNNKSESWHDLVQDDFMAFYKAAPEKRKPDDMKATHKINHAAMSKAIEQREWKELRTYTELDEWTSAVAAVQFGEKLEELFDEQEELGQAQQRMSEQDRNIQNIINEMHENAGNGVSNEELAEKLMEALQDYDNAAKELDKEIKGNNSNIRQKVRQAAKDAKDDIEGTDEAMQMFGTDPGYVQRMPQQARIELAARIAKNRKLRELAMQVGRFVRLALGEQARKIVHAPDEVFETELGNDLARVLPSQTVYLADPELEDLFFTKYVEHSLVQYQLRGTEHVGQGAIIVMLDSSGSMMGVPEIWSKAVAIALLHIAAKQKRDFHAILFSSAHDPILEWEFKNGIANPLQVLEFAETIIGGGTDFMKPITRAVELLTKQYSTEGSAKGDLVFVTDGESHVTDEFVDRYFNSKEELAFRMYGCLIGSNPDILHTLCDTIYRISDFATGEDVKEVFGFV